MEDFYDIEIDMSDFGDIDVSADGDMDIDLDSLFLDEQPKESNYSAVRGGLASFAEAALGVGDELDAFARMLTDGSSYEDAVEASRRNMRRFERKNENLSTAIDVAGFAAGFLVPGAALAKAGQGLSKAQMIKRGAALGAAEGAAYGFLSGEEEEGRLAGAGIGAAGGGALGGLATKFLTRSADEIAAIDAREAKRAAKAAADDSFIWGEEGLGEVKAAKAGRGVSSSKLESDTKQKTRKLLEAGTTDEELGFFGSLGKSLGETVGRIGDGINYATRGTAERLVQSTGNKRVGMLLKDVEGLSQRMDATIDETFELFADVDKAFRNNPILQREYINLGQSIPGQKGKGAEKFDYSTLRAAAKTPDEKKAVDELIATVNEARSMDIPGYVKENDWAPSLYKGTDSKNAKAGDYESPFVAAKNYTKDVQQARILAQVFKVTPEELAKIKPKRRADGVQSRVDTIIELIEKKAGKEAGKTVKTKKGKTKRVKTADSAQAAANLADALRSTLIHSKAGAAAAGSLARKVTSTGLLANPGVAFLNVIEGATLPIYQSGVKAWAKTVPTMLWATFNKGKSEAKPSWISTKEFGQDKQFMGEVAAQAEDGVAEMVDKVGAFFYKWTGVQRVNDMGAEGVANTALTFARDMAKDGSPKALRSLRHHAASEGLSKAEFNTLVRDLKSGAPRSEAIERFATRAMLAAQPRGATAMPQLYNDMPNGRVFYSMLSYMNRMYNIIRNDIGRELYDVQKYGINTPRGQAAFKRASASGVKFAALLGLANGIWDDTRKALFDGEKREALLNGEIRGADLGLDDEFLGFLMETTANQLASLGSSGFANIRAEEYGGGTFDITPAPVQMVQKGAGGLFDVVTEQDPTEFLRFTQAYVPGVSQLDKARRAISGDRLFQEIAYDED